MTHFIIENSFSTGRRIITRTGTTRSIESGYFIPVKSISFTLRHNLKKKVNILMNVRHFFFFFLVNPIDFYCFRVLTMGDVSGGGPNSFLINRRNFDLGKPGKG